MASLKLNHIYKVYPNGAKAVNDFCMDIEDKEFVVFVGPSGCGKSTTLRMIAGLEEITAGELSIDDDIVNDVEPKDRDIAMVFQNYALYPHMTVYDNMAFGLKLRKIPDIKKDKDGNPVLDKDGKQITIMRHYTKKEIDARVMEAAGILGITDYLKRKPAAMSGGQRQRVALGRAIVREPKVFLLDEPLSNLDAKLRTQMRSEISKLHSKIQTTFIYVTHDQVEAMTMGTRIVVMKDGFVQQIDTPRNLYSYPVNKFVAGFIGTPQMNFYAGKLKVDGDKVRVTFDNTDVDMLAPYEYFAKADIRYLDGEKPLTLGIRLEHVSVDPDKYPFKAKCRVSYVEDLGIDGQVYADFNINSEDTVTESATKIIIKAPAGSFYRTGEVIDISMDLSHLHVFDAETENTIAPRIPLQTVTSGTVNAGNLNIFGASLKLPPAISPANGEYEVHVPTSAISLGGPIKAKFVKNENVNGQNLVEMDINGRAVFVLADEKADVNSGLSIDLKQIALLIGGEEVVKPLPYENGLEGKIVKHKKVTEGEDGKQVKELEFSLNVGYAEEEAAVQKDGSGSTKFVTQAKPFFCPNDVAEKIINGGGLKIFKAPLDIKFSPYAVTLGEGGVPAHVVRVLDYGTEKFAECAVTVLQPVPVEEKPVPTKKLAKFGYNCKEKFAKMKKTEFEPVEKKVYIAVDKDFNESDIEIIPDISKCGVYDIELDIRLV